MKIEKRYIYFVGCIIVYWCIGFTSADFVTMPMDNFKDVVINALQWGVVSLVPILFLLAIAIHRGIFAVIFPITTLIAAVLAYYRVAYHFMFNSFVVYALFQNNIALSTDYLSWQLGLYMLVHLFIIFVLVRWRWQMGTVFAPKYSFLQWGVLGVLVVVLLHPQLYLQPKIKHRIPTNVIYVLNEYFEGVQTIRSVREQCVKVTSSLNDSLVVVVIIGESLRPDHLGINGYYRSTTPVIEALGAVSLPYITSNYSYTAHALPNMVTRADSLYPERMLTERSFVDVFEQADYYSAWISNQDYEQEYIALMNESDTTIYTNMSKTRYSYEQWLDGALLAPYNALLENTAPRKLIVLHTIGSHWWYASHYTPDFEYYRPVTKSRIVAQCTQEEMINTYDNTIVYSDWFWGEVIAPLQNKNAVVFYLSDHGQALGEDQNYLHSASHPTMFKTAAWVWMSSSYRMAHSDKWDALNRNSKDVSKVDFLFHSLLDVASVSSDQWDSEKSILQLR